MINGDPSRAVWRKSTHSGGEGNCVEVAGNLPEIVAVRDSKNPGGASLMFARGTWDSFTGKVKSGTYDEKLEAALRRAPRLRGALLCIKEEGEWRAGGRRFPRHRHPDAEHRAGL